MSTITIQPGQPGEGVGYNVHKPLPYPFHIDIETGKCTRGRGTSDLGDDPTGTTPWVLLGLQDGDVQELARTRSEWTADPQSAVGLRPVFIDWSGSIFALGQPITHVTVDAPKPVVA